jgi:hypothetical protein
LHRHIHAVRCATSSAAANVVGMNERLSLRIDPQLLAALERAAAEDRRKLSDDVRLKLEDAMARREQRAEAA